MLLVLAGCTKDSAAPADPGPAPPPPVVAKRTELPVIVAFGDSLSAGYGLEPGQGYPDYLQKLLDAEGYKYKVIAEALSGDTSSGGLSRLDQVLSHQPQIVIVELGANDGLRGIPVAKTRENLDTILARLTAAKAQVLLAGITLPRNYGADYIRDFDSIYPTLAKKHGVALLPFLLEGVALDKRLMLPDALHPNARGNAKVAETVFRALQPLLRR